MANNGQPPPKPTITLPPRSSAAESLFGGGSSSGGPGTTPVPLFGFSPGPMTLVSSFFSEGEECKSFSQLLAGAVASSTAAAPSSSGEVRLRHNWTAATPPGVFSIPPGMSPAALFDSPGFLSHLPVSFGHPHQQALPQMSAQAQQPHGQHVRPEQASSSTLPAVPPFTASSSAYQQQKQQQVYLAESRETSDISYDQRAQSAPLVVDKPADDGYNWRKYGQKQVKGSEFPRSYYKCTSPGCPVKKKVERSLEGQITEIIYKGQHNHDLPQNNKRAKDHAVGDQSELNRLREVAQESSQLSAERFSGMSDSEELGDAETGVEERDEDEPDPKRRSADIRVSEAASSHRTVTEPKIIVQTTSEVDLLDDGYRWRKYGQKVVKGNPYPRSYYKCTTPGCNVRKHIERASTDPKAVITTYEGKHSHDVPAARASSHSVANSFASQLREQNMSSESDSLAGKADFRDGSGQPMGRLRLKEEKITQVSRDEKP
ncbi:probable WRKY transcription factor 3 [Punica granatum]|uniref:WRKY domain-containing protein n=2 Tax=Punica granatum TaxID=22663 RepID=A0A218WTE4_PUNGR|nr:probable WRKY transcription factor 3 [Punica granatum]XP_031399358.1 probable WRKY transcription factor 3 [Punica granatum]OWM75913.1 hypothetical protein CDL15_Pgr009557 [Punica granatum]PKI36788.1 hypothetical protein CRG98_042737 [Punica granatum]